MYAAALFYPMCVQISLLHVYAYAILPLILFARDEGKAGLFIQAVCCKRGGEGYPDKGGIMRGTSNLYFSCYLIDMTCHNNRQATLFVADPFSGANQMTTVFEI